MDSARAQPGHDGVEHGEDLARGPGPVAQGLFSSAPHSRQGEVGATVLTTRTGAHSPEPALGGAGMDDLSSHIAGEAPAGETWGG
ncbi:hypothetical protein [Nocardia sp. NPDC057227]|uniref:hypothetical protein n=1 Tax=Nocardia sp. NPDC057227 TaxID=3346056 RepID=UPI00363CAC98